MSNAEKNTGEKILFFDGVCNLCNGIVSFVIKRNRKGNIKFCPLQSDHARLVLQKFELEPEVIETFVLLEYDSIYLKSDAALRLFKSLDGLWSVLYIFKILPKTFRDCIYDIIAGRRYMLFGKKEQCMVPTPEIKKRFIDC